MASEIRQIKCAGERNAAIFRPDANVSALAAGVIGGFAGFGTFLVIHALWIVPIWFIAPLGVSVAAGGGMAVGWAWHIHRGHLPKRAPARALTLFVAAALVLLPSEPVAIVFAPSDPLVLAVLPQEVVMTELLTGLMIYAALAGLLGAIVGGLLARTWRAAAITALAAVAFGIGIGHNAPLLGNSWAAPKMWIIMLSASAVAAAAFATAEWALARGRSQAQPSGAESSGNL